jgi:hypothetical protein
VMPFRELHMRTISGRRYNFCDPNTHLDDRLNSDGSPKNWSKPINKVGPICMRHDIAYESGNRLQVDENLLRELNELDNRDLTVTSWLLNISRDVLSVRCITCENKLKDFESITFCFIGYE